MIVNV